MIINLERLYNGWIADARDYEVEEAKKKRLNIKFYIEDTGRWITITNDKLDTGDIDPKVQKSKIPQAKIQEYHLILYTATPDYVKVKEKKEKEELTRKGAQLLLSAWKDSQRHDKL